MPKVTGIDSKTGTPTGEIAVGRFIKAKTNATPQDNVLPPRVEGQPNASETNPEAKQLDPKFEALAKREAMLRAEKRDSQASLDAKIKDAVDKALGDYKAKLKSSPLDVLNEEGLTYDQLVEQAMNYPDQTTRTLQSELNSIKRDQAKMQEDSKKAADSQRESAVKQIRYDVTDLIDNDPQFETIKGSQSTEDVVELITRTFDETGRVLGVEQAAKMVEDELFEEVIKLTQLAKVKAKLAPPPVEMKQKSNQTQHTTLTNNMAVTRPMTSRERAIAAFKGEKY